jgi:hypothetical protein
MSSLVLTLRDIDRESAIRLLARYSLNLIEQPDATVISGSYWGESEAGLIGDNVYVRPDTPLHSLLHEASHFVCMNGARRALLERDAGGDYDEENAVCFLQVVLADELPAFGRERMWLDMDRWGYTFRLGSARVWFEQDADDARCWLISRGILDRQLQPTWTCVA